MTSSVLMRPMRTISKAWSTWSSMNMGTISASVAYYAIFSLAPLLIIAMSVASFALGDTTVTSNVMRQFTLTFGHNGATFIQSLIQNSSQVSNNITISIIGFLVIIIGATNTFSQLKIGLDTVFAHQPTKKQRGFWAMTLRRIFSIGLILSVGFLLVVSLVMTAIITLIATKFIHLLPDTQLLIQGIEIAISLVLTSLFFSGMYKLLPSRRIGWKPALIAGLFSGILFFATKTILSLVLISDTAFSAFGSASALVLLIVWIYIMSQIFFLGAFVARIFLLPKVK